MADVTDRHRIDGERLAWELYYTRVNVLGHLVAPGQDLKVRAPGWQEFDRAAELLAAFDDERFGADGPRLQLVKSEDSIMEKYAVKFGGSFSMEGPDEFKYEEVAATTIGGISKDEARGVEDALKAGEVTVRAKLADMLTSKRKDAV